MQRNDAFNGNNNGNNANHVFDDEYDVEYDDDGSDDDSELDESYFYAADESSRTRFNIVLCEIYNRNIHGYPSSGSNVDTHYLVSHRFKMLNINLINDIYYFMNAEYMNLTSYNDRNHPTIRNYHNIIQNPYYIRPEIAECHYLKDNECIAILKTFWIRIVQRAWRRVLNERQQIILDKKRSQFSITREIREPKRAYWPSLKGMLCNYK
jgi:hypothetical protein